MPSVSIVGVRGSGKTTALVLLHESLVAYANRNKKGFQFESDLTSSPYIYDSVRKMRQGDWPDAPVEGYPEEVKLKLRFKKIFGWNEIEIDFYDISGEDLKNVVDALSDKNKSQQQVIDDLRQKRTLAAVLNSDVFIFIVDSLVCDTSHSKESELKKGESDWFLTSLWRAIVEYRKQTWGKVKGLGIIFAKYDEAETFMNLGTPLDYYVKGDLRKPLPKNTQAQVDATPFSEAVKTNLSSTWGALQYDIQKIRGEGLHYFRSGIMMKQDEETGQVSIGLPLTFSINEYIRLAKWLSSI